MPRQYIGPRVYVVLPPGQLAAVDAIADARGVSRGEVLREAVAEYISRRKAGREPR